MRASLAVLVTTVTLACQAPPGPIPPSGPEAAVPAADLPRARQLFEYVDSQRKAGLRKYWGMLLLHPAYHQAVEQLAAIDKMLRSLEDPDRPEGTAAEELASALDLRLTIYFLQCGALWMEWQLTDFPEEPLAPAVAELERLEPRLIGVEQQLAGDPEASPPAERITAAVRAMVRDIQSALRHDDPPHARKIANACAAAGSALDGALLLQDPLRRPTVEYDFAAVLARFRFR